MELVEFFQEFSEWLGRFTAQYGSLGIAAAMFAESAGVPFASAVVLFTSGSMIFSGKISFWAVFVASTTGIILGSLFSYLLGFLSGFAGRRLKKTLWLRKKEPPARKRRSRVYSFWEKYGSFSVFMGQFWGVTRTFISFPAGAMQMNILIFIVYTALGGALFSLGAIGFSIIFTGAVGLILKLFAVLFSLSPWVWPGVAFLIAVLIYFYRRLGWKVATVILGRNSRERPPRKK
jgi:membrane protein DedA with SNARE-associated domain